MALCTDRVRGLAAHGPRLVLELEPSPSHAPSGDRSDEQRVERVRIEALIDTGATVSVLRRDVALHLGLRPAGSTEVATPSQSDVTCLEYVVRLLLAADVVLDVRLVALPLDHLDVDLLLGRDVLAKAVFVYQGHDESFTLAL